MQNLAMERKLQAGECIDVGACDKTAEGDYVLTHFFEGSDYADAKNEAWVWSIGRHKETGQIVASTSSKFYMHPDYECLWLR